MGVCQFVTSYGPSVKKRGQGEEVAGTGFAGILTCYLISFPLLECYCTLLGYYLPYLCNATLASLTLMLILQYLCMISYYITVSI